MRLIYFIISTILVNPILSQPIIPKGFEDKIDYWYLDNDSICSQITYLNFEKTKVLYNQINYCSGVTMKLKKYE